MKTKITLLAMLLTFSVISADITVEEPLLTISGTYKPKSVKVKDRELKVLFELKKDGSVSGYYESWVEKTYTDKPPKLIINKSKFIGSWTFKDNQFHIRINASFVPIFEIKDTNGIKIKITD
jgi:hypothetical protein